MKQSVYDILTYDHTAGQVWIFFHIFLLVLQNISRIFVQVFFNGIYLKKRKIETIICVKKYK